MLGKRLDGSDFELVSSGEGNKLLAVVARLCLPPRGCFSTLGICKRLRLGICKRLRLLSVTKRLRLEKVGVNG